MKKFVVSVVFFLCLCVGFAFVTEYKSSPNVSISTDYVSPNTSEVAKVTPTECVLTPPKTYKLKEYEGNVAIFKSSDILKPFKITPISIEDLPPTDQEMLKQGIEASSEEELYVLLEDYGS